MTRVFKSKPIQEQLSEGELSDLTDDFKRYMSGQSVPSRFGRDVKYDHPDTQLILRDNEVSHIHLVKESIRAIQALQFHKTSDTHLVYCPAANDDNCYLLMAILEPAHEEARSNGRMMKLGEMAENFRKRF